jgi:hypothetical protein
MATKKRTKRKSTRSKKTIRKKATATKKQAQKKKAPKKQARKKAAPTRAIAKTKASKKTIRAKPAETTPRETRRKTQGRNAFSQDTLGSRSAGQSGDLQGLSDVEGADSESVEELVEEGNAFEAGVVTGVEDAGNRGVREVRTREVPEDDVPGEYLDED